MKPTHVKTRQEYEIIYQAAEPEKWTPYELNLAMSAVGWEPTPAPGYWLHPDGARIDLNALMRDGRAYWHQLAERHATPPTTHVPEDWDGDLE